MRDLCFPECNVKKYLAGIDMPIPKNITLKTKNLLAVLCGKRAKKF